MSLRAAKRTSTRTAIEHSGWSLAQTRPWTEITIDDIASAAGIARRTFFNYFESKEQLQLSLGAWRPGTLLAAVQQRPETEPPWGSLRAALLGLLPGSSAATIERMRAMWSEPSLLERNVAGRLKLEQDLVDEFCRRQPSLDPVDALLISAVFLTTARTALQAWVDNGQPGELIDAVARSIDAVRISLPGD